MSSLKRKSQHAPEVANSNVPSTIPPALPSEDLYDTGFLSLPETRFPLGTPIQSKRSRKFYSDLNDEREFLLHVKELWKKKLANLKEDKKLLEKMKDIKKHELKGVEPLFCPEEKELPTENDIKEKEAIDQPTSIITENLGSQDNQHDPFKIVNGQLVIKDPSMLATLQELDKIYSGSQRAQEVESSGEEEEEEVEEDDEEARKALNRMLEEFGDGF